MLSYYMIADRAAQRKYFGSRLRTVQRTVQRSVRSTAHRTVQCGKFSRLPRTAPGRAKILIRRAA